MYKNESHAKQRDPLSITDPISKAKAKGPVRIKASSKEETDAANKKKADKAAAIKEANKRKAARGDFSYMTDAEKQKSAKELSQVQAQKSRAAETKRNNEKAAADAAKAKAEKKDPAPEKKGPAPKKSTSYADALKKDSKLNSYIKQRKGLTKGTPEYNAVQNKINAAYGKGPQRSTKTVDSSKKKSTIKSSVVDYDPAAEKKKAADARNAKEKAANESKASKLAETKKAATTKIDKKKLKSQAGEGYKDALADAKKKKSSAKESLKQKASGKKAIEYKEKTKKEKIQDTKEDFSFDRKKLKREKGTDAVKEARAKKKEEVGRAKGKKKIVKADNRASYAKAAKDMITSNPIGSESPMFFAGMKMNKSKPMMKGKLCMNAYRSGKKSGITPGRRG